MLETRERLKKHVQKQQKIREAIKQVFREMFENTCQAIEQLDGEKLIEQTKN